MTSKGTERTERSDEDSEGATPWESAEERARYELSISALERRITSQAAHLAAATAAWLELISEFDEREGWHQWGYATCAHWLSFACSLSPSAAREHVRVAKALRTLPRTTTEFKTDHLSYSKVRAIVRAGGRVDEDTLVNLALIATAAQLEKTVRGYRKASGTGLDQQRKRRARSYWDEDGMLVFSARLTPDEGAALQAALHQMRQMERTARAGNSQVESGSESGERVRNEREACEIGVDFEAFSLVDDLVRMANLSLAVAPEDRSGDTHGLVVVHIDQSLADAPPIGGIDRDSHSNSDPNSDTDTAQHLCRIGDGPGIELATAERMACDSDVQTVLKGGPFAVLGIGRKDRRIPPALRTALHLRDEGCRYPGCVRTHQLQAHHIVHWFHGGPTDPENLALFCRYHHMRFHEGGFTVVASPLPDGTLDLSIRTPDGELVGPTSILTPDDDEPLSFGPASTITPDCIRPGWRGEPFLLAETVGVLCRADLEAAGLAGSGCADDAYADNTGWVTAEPPGLRREHQGTNT